MRKGDRWDDCYVVDFSMAFPVDLTACSPNG